MQSKRSLPLADFGKNRVQSEPDRQVQDHSDHGRGHSGKGRRQGLVGADLLDVRSTQEYPQKTRRERDPDGARSTEGSGHKLEDRAQDCVGGHETDILQDQDERSGVVSAMGRPVDSCAVGKATGCPHRLLGHIAQHSVGTAEGDHGHLAEENGHTRVHIIPSEE